MLLQQLTKKKMCKFLCHYSYYSRNLLVCIHTLVDNLCNAQNSLIKYDFFLLFIYYLNMKLDTYDSF